MRASIWTHPKTNEKRIYINGFFGYGEKFFITEGNKNTTAMNIWLANGKANTIDEMGAGEAWGEILEELNCEDYWTQVIEAIEATNGSVTVH